MVINDHYRFVFLHIPKTGGSSMAQVLRRLKGNNRRLVAKRTKHETFDQLQQEWERRRGLWGRFWNRPQLHDYLLFGFVRNPWDRMSSLYRYLQEKRARPELAGIRTFEDFVIEAAAADSWIRRLHSMRPQVDFFPRDEEGRVVADFVGHFEYLEEDFTTVTRRLGIGATLPHVNRSTNASRDYRREYSEASAAIVGELFRRDIDHFGYRFEDRFPVRRCSDQSVAGS